MSLLVHQPRPGCPHHCHLPGRALGPHATAVWNPAGHSQSSAPLGALPLASSLSLLVAGAPCCPMPCSPTPISTPQSLGPHLPLNMCLHHLLGLHSAQGPMSVPQPPSSRGPSLCLSPPHCLRAPLCSGFLATLPLCHLLAAPPCPSLPPPQGPLSPSPFQVAGCSLPALPISCLLPPFSGAHLFTVGRAEDPRGTASPARLLERSEGTRLQW